MYLNRNCHLQIPQEFYQICLCASFQNSVSNSFSFCSNFIVQCITHLSHNQFIISGENIIFKAGDNIYIAHNDALSLSILNKAGYVSYAGNQINNNTPLEIETEKIISSVYYNFFYKIQQEVEMQMDGMPKDFVSKDCFELLVNSLCSTKEVFLNEAWKNDSKFLQLRSMSQDEFSSLSKNDFSNFFTGLVQDSNYLKCADWIHMRYPDINRNFDFDNFLSQKPHLEAKKKYTPLINKLFDYFLLFQQGVIYKGVPEDMLNELYNAGFDKKNAVIARIRETLLKPKDTNDDRNPAHR